jgi:hypothetical protein
MREARVILCETEGRVRIARRDFAADLISRKMSEKFAAWLKPSPDSRRKATANSSTHFGAKMRQNSLRMAEHFLAQDDSAELWFEVFHVGEDLYRAEPKKTAGGTLKRRLSGTP